MAGRDGEVVVDPNWEAAMSFSEGLAPVRYKDHRGFTGTSGEVAQFRASLLERLSRS